MRRWSIVVYAVSIASASKVHGSRMKYDCADAHSRPDHAGPSLQGGP